MLQFAASLSHADEMIYHAYWGDRQEGFTDSALEVSTFRTSVRDLKPKTDSGYAGTPLGFSKMTLTRSDPTLPASHHSEHIAHRVLMQPRPHPGAATPSKKLVLDVEIARRMLQEKDDLMYISS